MLNVINILPILKEHFRTLREDTSLFSLGFIFIALPLLLSFCLFLFRIVLTKDILNTLITSFAIFVGFIINVLVILLKNKDGKIRIRNKLVEHLTYNLLYALVLGLVILFLTIFILALIPKISAIVLSILSLLLYSLVFNFIFTLLMISKRFFVIFYCKISDTKGDKHGSQS